MKPYPLDLIFLQESHSVFQVEELKGNICIYSVSEEFKDNYEMMILTRAAELQICSGEIYIEEALEKY